MTAGQYHINLETGEPGSCSARKGNCPFGGDELHFTTEDGARAAFEVIAAAEKAKALQAWKKKPRNAAQSNDPYSGDPYVSGHGGGGHGRRGSAGVGRHGVSAPKVAPRITPRSTPTYSGGHGYSGHGR